MTPTLHIAAAIFLNERRQVLLVRKRDTTAFMQPGGKVDSGEQPLAALIRELQEELGLTAPLEYLGSFPAGPETANEHMRLYRATTDDAPVPDPHEIESLDWADPQDVALWIEQRPDDFTPPFRLLFRWYFARHSS